jgi:nonribosomal peptide synthetase protein BlmIV
MLSQEGDRMAFKTSPCFVDSVWEVLGPLLAGVPLVTVPPAVMRDPAQVGCCCNGGGC